jgi:hypothetical protein
MEASGWDVRALPATQFGSILLPRVDKLDRTDLEQRSQHVCGSTMFDDAPTYSPVDVHTSESHWFARWCHPQPLAQVSALCHDAGGYPFTLRDLALNR